ncbi:MAG: hypothetical protein AAF700_13040 [Pseudomonadota bacterium]
MPTLALFGWPLAAMAFLRGLPRVQALIWTALLGYLFLPEAFGIDLPGLPPITKYTVISGTLLIMVRLTAPKGHQAVGGLVDAAPVFGKVLMVLIAVLFLSSLLTVATNRAPLVFGPTVLPGLGVRDLISMTSNTLLLIIPFLVARRHLATPEAHRALMKALVYAGLFYSLLMLIEIRLSPQLHNWVYGYHQHSFAQHIRGGDFRPKVFLAHGLTVGLFMMMCILAAFALARGRDGERQSAGWYVAGLWLLGILFLSSNLGATVLALLFVPLMFLGGALRILAILSVTVAFLSYPVLRSAGFVPVDAVERAAATISEERAQSFAFRLKNEDLLLARANEKPLVGWGGWSRNRVFDERGVDVSTPDGRWIIELGTGGWLRYIGLFGLVTLSLLVLRRTASRKDVPIETTAMGLIMAASLINLIPNSAFSPINWMIAGALAGFVQFDHRHQLGGRPEDEKQEDRSGSRTQRYTRFESTPADRGDGE